MDTIREDLIKFENELTHFRIVKYNEIPDIDLYMDQTLAFLNKRLSILKKKDEDTIVTASMINNYVKAGVIPAPISKKYTKRHLAYIVAVCFLKQILSMNEIKIVIDFLIETKGEKDAYDYFCSALEQSLQNCCRLVKADIKQDTEKDLEIFSLYFATKALANKIYAEKCIYLQNQSLNEKKIIEIKKELEKNNKN